MLLKVQDDYVRFLDVRRSWEILHFLVILGRCNGKNLTLDVRRFQSHAKMPDLIYGRPLILVVEVHILCNRYISFRSLHFGNSRKLAFGSLT